MWGLRCRVDRAALCVRRAGIKFVGFGVPAEQPALRGAAPPPSDRHRRRLHNIGPSQRLLGSPRPLAFRAGGGMPIRVRRRRDQPGPAFSLQRSGIVVEV